MSDPRLEWRDTGWIVKVGDAETPPFTTLALDSLRFLTGPGDAEGAREDQLTALLNTLPLTNSDKDRLRKQLLLTYLPAWRHTNPPLWIARHRHCYTLYMTLLSKWVKHDWITRQIVFLTALSAYSPNPLNLFVRGPSSIGKSYTVMQSIKFFDLKKDVWLLGGMSPTALVHDYATMVDESGAVVTYDEVDWKGGEGRDIKYVVDLTGKILVFLEAPSQDTFQRLRPILSHDTQEVRFTFTDKAKGGSLRTRHVYLKGFPATIFCTVDPTFQEELATRSINITPEMTEEKYRDAIILQGEKAAMPWRNHNPDPTLTLYRDNVADLKRAMTSFEVVIPYGEALSQCYPFSQPRDMRDFSKLVSLLQQYTYFHLWQRPWLEGTGYERRVVLATLKDFADTVKIFSWVAETTRSGLPGNVVSFFSEVMVPLQREMGSAIDMDAVGKKWRNTYHTTRSKATLRKNYLDPIRSVGWIDEDADPDDRRKTLLRVIGGPEQSLEGFEASVGAAFREAQLEAWVAGVRERGNVVVALNGETVDWAEFPYKYFCDWI